MAGSPFMADSFWEWILHFVVARNPTSLRLYLGPDFIVEPGFAAEILGETKSLDDLGRRIDRGIPKVFALDQTEGGFVRGGVAVEGGEAGRDVRAQEKIQELLADKAVGSVGQDREVIHPHLSAFPGKDEAGGRVLFHAAGGIPIVSHGGHDRFIQDLVLAAHPTLEAEGALLGGQQEIANLLEFRRVSAVGIKPEVAERGADHVAHGIEQQERTGLELGVKNEAPGFREDLVVGLADVEAGGAPLVGDGITVAGVPGRILETIFEVAEILDVLVAQRHEQLELDHGWHTMVRRHDNIILRGAPRLELGHHGVLVLEVIQVHLAIVELLEFGDDARVNVLAPDKEVQFEMGGGGRQDHSQHQQQDRECLFHAFAVRFDNVASLRSSSTRATVAKREARTSREDKALMSGVMPRLTDE